MPQCTAEKVQKIIRNSTGTSCYHFNSFSKAFGVVYTDGVKAVAEAAEAYWLINQICASQAKVRKVLNRDMQFWKLIVMDDESAILSCERDTNDVVFKVRIGYTDFPKLEDDFKIWLELGETSFGNGRELAMVAMLPEER